MKYYIVKAHQKYVYLVTNESATYIVYKASAAKIDCILLSFICKLYDIDTTIDECKVWDII